MISHPLVSVIVPVFNASKTLTLSLDSLFAQTYRHLEILLINDCSTDDSLQVIDKYIKLSENNADLKIKVLNHDVNCGVASARNTGLDNATGEYIYYVDADDWIEPETLGVLVNEAQAKHADIVGHELWMKYEKERYLKMPDVADGTDAFKKMATGQLRWNLWLYLVKRSLYTNNNIRFIDGMNMGEDMMVMGKLFLNTQRITIVHRPFYHYVAYNPSSLTKNKSGVRVKQVIANMSELERLLINQHNKELETYIQFLKLQVKIPLLISNKKSDFNLWHTWFPEANMYASISPMPLRTRILQYLAANRYFGILKLHYWLTDSLIKIFFR